MVPPGVHRTGGLFCLAFLAGVTWASPQYLSPRQSCNTPSNRQYWSPGFDINTDYEVSTPVTGVTRNYTLTITEIDDYIGGDGVPKTKAMLVNGGFPGPTIEADWGDTIEVTVVNKLITNGTSIHFHGVRQLNTNSQDGTNGITECPVPPNASKTYRFRATQYGTSWYHSHFSAQYGNGVAGPIVLHGPAAANYDVDLGAVTVSDWYYGAVDQIMHRVNDPNHPFIPGIPGVPPPSDNILINGRNIDPRGTGSGSYARLRFRPGQKHLLRLINPSVDNTYSVSIVGHNLTVVATDFVPVDPVTVSSLYITVGQRYDVVVEADQAVDNYWFNVTLPGLPCGTSNNPYPAAIIAYDGASNSSLPTITGTAPNDALCADSLAYEPVVPRSVSVVSFTPTPNDTLRTNIITSRNGTAHVFWPVNDSPMNVSWNDPTLEYVRNGTTDRMPREENVVSVPEGGITTFWLIENNSSVPHPLHLHGHDLLVLGASPPLADPFNSRNALRTYDPSTDAASLKGNNPTRRDTTVLPAWGWLVVAFETNNPGSWLFHCHVAWHVSQGFSVQFLEQLDAIPKVVDLSQLAPECRAWDAYYPEHDPFHLEDSGI